MKHRILILPFYLFAFLLLSCGPQLPKDYTSSDKQPDIYPDYKGVTVPVNMAPLTFEMNQRAEQMVTRFTVGGEELLCGGDKIQPGQDDGQPCALVAGIGSGAPLQAVTCEPSHHFPQRVGRYPLPTTGDPFPPSAPIYTQGDF